MRTVLLSVTLVVLGCSRDKPVAVVAPQQALAPAAPLPVAAPPVAPVPVPVALPRIDVDLTTYYNAMQENPIRAAKNYHNRRWVLRRVPINHIHADYGSNGEPAISTHAFSVPIHAVI
ncbi:MAG: hypothetical protein ACRCZF_18055, partial [Gemmataceae bacterium]